MASLEVRGVYKDVGATQILHGVDITAADGEFLTLVGPSGCGKSTLLRLIAGLEEVSSGEIYIGGVHVNGVSPKDRDIAMVFQNYALYPNMKVRENMAFALEMRNRTKAQIAERVTAAASMLGLGSLLDRYPRQLSGGQRQRVAMGRAIVRDPKVFLFDEPLSNLDAKLRVAMRAEIKDLHERLKTTTIYVTHDQVEAMTMADRIVVMKDGLVVQVGNPLDLYDKPTNVFVAAFIGSPSMNLLTGSLSAAGDRLNFAAAPNQLVETPPALSAHVASLEKPVVFGIRPEHIDIADDGLKASVVVIEPTGSETMIVARIEGRDDTVAVVLRDRLSLQRGAQIHLRPQMGKAHWFDSDTGARFEI